MTSRQVFEKFVPLEAVDYCDELYQNLNFEFRVTRSRKTKLGDFRYQVGSKKASISVNNDLNPFAFLLTYLHEVAHLMTFNQFKGRVDPHGKEWKNAFKKVAAPLLTEQIFPE